MTNPSEDEGLDRVVVAGAGAAGVSCCLELRRLGFEGAITLLGDEPGSPCDRPPLSKQILVGDWEPERAALATTESLAAKGVEHRGGVTVTSLTPWGGGASHTVGLSDGGVIEAEQVVIATGGRPKRLPGMDAQAPGRVLTLHTMADALALRTALQSKPHVAVVGGGFLGLEVAAAARGMGCEVTVLAGSSPLLDAVGATVSQIVAETHRQHGVKVEVGARVERIERVEGAAGGLPCLVRADGSAVQADLVVVAAGFDPNTQWLPTQWLEADGSVACDESYRVAPGVFVAGDAACRRRGDGSSQRVQHRLHAGESGAAVAATIMGVEPPSTVPFWWSDQFDLRLQGYGETGCPAEGDEEVVWARAEDGSPRVVLHVSAGRVIGAVGISSPRLLRQARSWVIDRVPLSELEPHTDAV